jgi:hypothetical protein
MQVQNVRLINHSNRHLTTTIHRRQTTVGHLRQIRTTVARPTVVRQIRTTVARPTVVRQIQTMVEPHHHEPISRALLSMCNRFLP